MTTVISQLPTETRTEIKKGVDTILDSLNRIQEERDFQTEGTPADDHPNPQGEDGAAPPSVTDAEVEAAMRIMTAPAGRPFEEKLRIALTAAARVRAGGAR